MRGKQVWLHQICQGGSLSLESFLQRAAGKLSKTILLWMQMNPFELHFRYVGVYGCQSPLRFWESCKHDTDSQSPSVVRMLQHRGKIWTYSNMATCIKWWWLTHRRPTLTLCDFFIQWWFPCKSDKYQRASEILQNKKEQLWNCSILSVLQVVNKHLKSSLQSTASWKRDSSRGLSGDICISPGENRKSIEHVCGKGNSMTAVF